MGAQWLFNEYSRIYVTTMRIASQREKMFNSFATESAKQTHFRLTQTRKLSTLPLILATMPKQYNRIPNDRKECTVKIGYLCMCVYVCVTEITRLQKHLTWKNHNFSCSQDGWTDLSFEFTNLD